MADNQPESLKRLNYFIRETPFHEVLNLSNCDIDDLQVLLPTLATLPNVTILNLENNGLESLPDDMSSLEHITSLGLDGNLFVDLASTLRSLATLPSLSRLTLNVSAQHMDAVRMSLPRVDDINSAALQSELRGAQATAAPDVPAPAPSMGHHEPVTMKEDDLVAVSELFEQVKGLRGANLTSRDDATLTNKMDSHLQKVMGELKTRLEGEDDLFFRQAEILLSKHQLFDLCFLQLISETSVAQPQHGALLRQLREKHADLFGTFPGVMQEMKGHYLKQIQDLHQELAKSQRETTELLEAAELLEKETHSQEQEKQTIMSQHEQEKGSWGNDMNWLKGENQKLIDKIAQLERARGEAPSAQRQPAYGGGSGSVLDGGGGAMMSSASPVIPGTMSPRRSPGITEARSVEAAPQSMLSGRSVAGSEYISQQPVVGMGGRAPPLKSPAFSGGGGGSVRVLTMGQLRQIVDEIYQSKIKFDKKCDLSHLPRETMEEHMYTFLNQKYGLKALIIEWATAIINGIKKYSPVDNDVSVFGKILRNEIDEEFRFVQKQLKETVAELLRVYLKGKYPLKRDDDITGIIKKRMAGHILEEEFVDIIKYMYNRDDSVAILLRLNDTREKQLMEYKESIRGSRHVIKPEDEQNAQKLAYAEFCKILLDFQLSGHEKFLHRFVALFRKFDQDRNGIVNEEEFTDVVDGVIGGDRQEELVEILNTCDPYDNKRVTFSQAVTALSGHLVAFNSAEMGH